jgi:hypothetical protein
MRFSLFPHFIFSVSFVFGYLTWPRCRDPFFIFTIVMFRGGGGGGVGVTSTHLGFIFTKFFPCLLVIISHYRVSYNLGDNIPPGEYSLSVDTSV